MRIGFVFTQLAFINQFEQVCRALRKRGNHIAVFPSCNTLEKRDFCEVINCRWDNFRFNKINNFAPDRLITFNGYHPSVIPAIKILKDSYKTFHGEMGWLPQRNHIYLDTDMGYGGEISLNTNSIKKNEVILNKDQTNVIDGLRESYGIQDVTGLPKKFILIPLQLEHDISIIKDSPYFKMMRNLVAFVAYSCPGVPIIVKQHPAGDPQEKYTAWAKLEITKDVKVIYDPSVRTIDLVPHCSAIVGINSTVMMESLLFYKPMISFGYSMLFEPNSHILKKGERLKEYFNLWSDPIKWKGRLRNGLKEVYDKMIFYLYSNQFNWKEPPPDWVVDKILNYDTRPRFGNEFWNGKDLR